MDLKSWRAAQQLSLEGCAEKFGFGSKGYWSDVENGVTRLPLNRAFEVESATAREVPADSLLTPEDAALLAEHRRLAGTPAEAAA